jgi:hypothetical protein
MINKLNDNDIFILDFNNIRNTMASDSIAKVAESLLQKKILMVNLRTSTYNTFQKYFENELFDYENQLLGKCLKTKRFSHTLIQLPNLVDFYYLKDDLKNKCRANIQKKEKPILIPSNVYSSHHFDLRRIFRDMDTVKITVYLMAKKLYDLQEEGKLTKYKLISSSFNGCILANLVALIMGKKNISLPHIGPELNEKDNRYLKYIKKNDKLVYIYDFIALGNEQKTVSIIAKLFKAEVIYSLGLTYYRPSENNTLSLIEFSDIIEHAYACADENDLIELMRCKNG